MKHYGDRYFNLHPQKVDLSHFVDWVSQQGAKDRLEYIIWKDPLMAVSRNTFIGDVLKYLGHDLQMYPKKYPEVEFDADATYLFSSEPFPFAKHVEWIKQQNVSSAIINGENISWFGIRTLRFLEAFQSLHRSSFYLRLKQRLA